MASPLWIITCTLYMATFIDGQCSTSLVFPEEMDSRNVRLTKATTQVTVAARISCDTPSDLPATDVDTTLSFTDTDNVVTDSSDRTLTILQGTTVSSLTFNVRSIEAVATETFMVSLASNSITPNAMLATLTFTLEAISEVSFDAPRLYEGELESVIDVVLVRTEPTSSSATFGVVEVNSTFLDLTPASPLFTMGSASATVTATVTKVDPLTDRTVQLAINSVSASLLRTRVENEAIAMVTILSSPKISVVVSSVTLSAQSISASFAVEIDRVINSDVTINLLYGGDNVITNPPSALVLQAGEDRASVTLSLITSGAHTFTVRITSVNLQTVRVDLTDDTTTYTVPDADVTVSIPTRTFIAAEGMTFQVMLVSDVTATEEIEIDVYTPSAADEAQLDNLPNAVIRAGQSSTVVGITVRNDGVAEGQMIVTIAFQSLTGGAIVDPQGNTITVTIPGNTGGSTNNGDTGTDTGTGGVIGTNTDGTSSSRSLSGGAIAGIVVGAVGAIVFIIMIAVLCGVFAMSSAGRFGGGGLVYLERPLYPSYARRYPSPVIYEVDY